MLQVSAPASRAILLRSASVTPIVNAPGEPPEPSVSSPAPPPSVTPNRRRCRDVVAARTHGVVVGGLTVQLRLSPGSQPLQIDGGYSGDVCWSCGGTASVRSDTRRVWLHGC